MPPETTGKRCTCGNWYWDAPCECGADLAELVADPEAAMDAMPSEEKAEYEEAQRSVVEARRAANRNEGRNAIS